MREIEIQCYSCYDASMFQLHGMTDKYNPKKESERYINHYKRNQLPIIWCIDCGKKKKYEQKGNGRWQEIKLEDGE